MLCVGQGKQPDKDGQQERDFNRRAAVLGALEAATAQFDLTPKSSVQANVG